MIERDYLSFESRLKAVIEALDHRVKVTEGIMEIWWDVLKPFPLDIVLQAIDRHLYESKFAPKPAEIVEYIEKMDGRPAENEAWAISINALDEQETIIWTAEMALAFEAARPLLKARDKQGAKLAFREAYSRLVAEARRSLSAVNWSVSIGQDKSKINNAISQALSKNQITLPHAKKYLIDPPAMDGRAIAGFLTGTVVEDEDDEITPLVAEKLSELRSTISSAKSRKDITSERNEKAKELNSIEFEVKRQSAIEYVESTCSDLEQKNEFEIGAEG